MIAENPELSVLRNNLVKEKKCLNLFRFLINFDYESRQLF